MRRSSSKFTCYLLSACFLLASGSTLVSAQKLTAEEIVAKHLNSIGTKEKRDGVKNRIAAGASAFESKLPARQTSGKAIIVSDANNLFFLSSFSSQDYPFEKIGYFAEKVSLPYISAGNRSPLGNFILDHNKMLTEGLLTGSISSLWPMQSPKGRFEAAGKKKVDGKDVYVVNYFPKSVEGDFYIKLFFDTGNFQHLQTEYGYITTPALNPMGTLGRAAAVRTTITETFGDYRDEGGLTLPHLYKIHYLQDSSQLEFNWEINISQYVFNQNLAPGFFTFEEK